MPRDVVALVSVEDFVSAVRVYSDRVHDLLRRGNIAADEAIEVTESFAIALLDAVVNTPDVVIDLAGWWFARALELVDRAGVLTVAELPDEPISLLSGTSGETQVRDALATLPDNERAAVILRDAYDLPPQAVAVALRRSLDATAALTSSGRLHLVSAYDDRSVPTLSGHTGRTTVDLPMLSQLAEGSLDSPRAAPLRRHTSNCPACEDVLETLAKGRRLAAGLPIIAMPEVAREDMIETVEARAIVVLPSHDLVLRAVDEDHDPKPTISPLLAIIAVALALLLGVAVALITRPKSFAAPASEPPVTSAASESPEFSVPPSLPAITPTTTSPSTSTTQRRSSSPSSAATTTSATPTTPSTTTSSAPVTAASIVLSPSRGPAGTAIVVGGSGFTPGTRVRVSITGGGSTTTRADANGRFTAQLTAPGPPLVRRTVTASGGGAQATASFQVTL